MVQRKMTREEYLDRLLATYSVVRRLAEKNGCKTIRLRHKEKQKDLVLHSLPEKSDAYEFVCTVKQKNLPYVYDVVGLDDGCIVLEEFIDGITVADVLETGKYRYIGAKRIISSLCDALALLHGQGIVHRDIKPENVMIDKNGRVVLIDFNASRVHKSASRDTVVMGTVGYASPEQMGIAQSDSRTDIYALGVLLNVMLTGRHPCEGTASGRAGRIIEKCTSIDPSKRYQTVDEVKKAL
ncbi:MAG: serine/threonine protein kinase [Clostridia bacterium]|nr:serine/threonine protein kinase [Clostridia bacterium]